MIHRILSTLAVFMAFNAFADWPPIVESKRDIAALPSSTPRVRARGLHDEDILELSQLPLLKHLDFWRGAEGPGCSHHRQGLGTSFFAGLAAVGFSDAWLLHEYHRRRIVFRRQDGFDQMAES